MTSGTPTAAASTAKQRTSSFVAVTFNDAGDSQDLKDSIGLQRSSTSASSSNGLQAAVGKVSSVYKTSSLERWTSMEAQMMQRLDAAGSKLSCLLFVVAVVGLLFLAEMRIFEGRHFAHLLRATPRQ